MAHMMRRTLAAFAIALAVVSALAAGGPATAQNYDGSGILKFGAFIQGDWSNIDIVEKPSNARPVLPAGGIRDDVTLSGVGFGATFGYDYRIGDIVYGVEADGSVSNNNNRVLTHTFASDYFATFRGRFGVYARPDLMLYGTFGLALIGVEYKPSVPGLGQNGNLKLQDTLAGLVVGAGAEFEPVHGVILFAEYLYASFADWDIRGQTLPAIDADVDSHLFRLGVKFKIGHDHYHDPVYRR